MIFKGSSSFHWVQFVIFNLFDQGKFCILVKQMVSLSEVVTDTEGIRLTSFLWLLSLILKGVSDFPTYCFPHLRQSIKINDSTTFTVKFISDVETFVCCFTRKCCCLFKLSTALTITSRDAWLALSAVVSQLTTLLFENLLLPMMSRRFLHRRYARLGLSLNFSFIFGSI